MAQKEATMNIAKTILGGVVALAFATTTAAPAAAISVLTFEGIGNLQPVGNFYNGGGGGSLGITMSPNTLAIVDLDAGGTGNFGGEPSPSTVMFFLTGDAAIMNALGGFDTGFSFYYSSINQSGSLQVFDGLDGTGNLLASLILPLTPSNGAPDPTGAYSPLVPIGVAFDGVARSVSFAGVQDQIAFDDVTFGSAGPGLLRAAVPVPGSLLLLLAGAGVGVVARLRKRSP
jgi:hypothetical protein